MICLSCVFAIFISVFILQEALTPFRLAGILIVIFGVVMVGGSDEKDLSISNDKKGKSR
jgi:drug/metabolite transporter (DMT)-like permease